MLLAVLGAVALPLEADEDDVDEGEGVGKESDLDVLARLQNCCESCSAEDSWSGHDLEMQDTIPGGNFPL